MENEEDLQNKLCFCEVVDDESESESELSWSKNYGGIGEPNIEKDIDTEQKHSFHEDDGENSECNPDLSLPRDNGGNGEPIVSISPLGTAILSGDEALCQTLLNDGVIPDSEDLGVAIFLRLESIATLLLSRGVNVNERDKYLNSPLLLAVELQLLSFVTLLLEAGADVNAMNNFNQTPLSIAHSKRSLKIAQKLVESGADVKGELGYLFLLKSILARNKALFDSLLDKGAPVTPVMFGNQYQIYVSPLEKAVVENEAYFVQKLLEKGADIDIIGCTGAYPLHWIFANSDMDPSKVVEILLENGARVNVQEPQEGKTPLHYGIFFKTYEIVIAFLNAGADFNIIDHYGMSPCHSAFDDPYNNSQPAERIRSIIGNAVKAKMASLNIKFQRCEEFVPIKVKSYNEFLEVCCEEVERMKLKRFGSITLHTLFLKFDDPSLAENERLNCFLNSESALKEFPQFLELLKIKFYEAKLKNDLLIKAIKCPVFRIDFLSESPPIQLPEEVIRHIGCYLSVEELNILTCI